MISELTFAVFITGLSVFVICLLAYTSIRSIHRIHSEGHTTLREILRHRRGV